MPTKPDTSFAYRASQFVLNNKDLIWCHCARPFIAYSSRHGILKNIPFCEVCKGLISNETMESLDVLAKHHNSMR
jgi:hypothetical protein